MKDEPGAARAIVLRKIEDYFRRRWEFTFSTGNVLIECLTSDLFDFGKHIIPSSIKDRHVSAFIFKGYWEDIGRFERFTSEPRSTDVVPEYSFSKPESPTIRIHVFCREAKLTAPPCARRLSLMAALNLGRGHLNDV